MTEKRLDRWFRSLDSNQLIFIYTSLFEKVDDINEFVDDCRADWNASTYEAKLDTYRQAKDFV